MKFLHRFVIFGLILFPLFALTASTAFASGATWIDRGETDNFWRVIASSADGMRLAAVADHVTFSNIYTSSDGGVTWTQQTSASYLSFNSIASSADGAKLAAVDQENGGDIWTATLSPTLTTSAASSISATGVILNGSIGNIGNGTSTVRGFVYGTGTSYGATTTESGSFSTGSFTANVSSLICNTTYHFEAYATNGYLGYGSDNTFMTSACSIASSGGGLIVGSGPLAPSAQGLPGYIAPRPQIDYPNGTIVYLDATTTASTSTPIAPTTTVSPVPITTPQTTLSASSSPFLIDRQLWDEGSHIPTLQQFLNTHGFPLVLTGWGSPGFETDTFGLYTYAALIKFQETRGLPATGYLGPLTRAAINSL
jgi:hypothetical protein